MGQAGPRSADYGRMPATLAERLAEYRRLLNNVQQCSRDPLNEDLDWAALDTHIQRLRAHTTARRSAVDPGSVAEE